MPETPYGWPYPAYGAAPNIPADLEALALKGSEVSQWIDGVLTGLAPITGTGTAEAVANVPFGITFVDPPIVMVSGRRSGGGAFYLPVVEDVTTSSFNVYVRLLTNTNFTASTNIRWLAIGNV